MSRRLEAPVTGGIEGDLCRSLLDTSSDAVLVSDLTGTVIMANVRSAELFGCHSEAELLGVRWTTLVADAGSDASGDQAELRRSSYRNRRDSALRRDGVRVPVNVSSSPIGPEGQPSGLLFMLHDVSEYQRLEDEHRAVFAATGDGMVVNTTEGIILDANPAFCEMYGYTREELVGTNVALLVHPDFHDLLGEFIDTISSGGSLHTRATSVRKDGSPFPVDVHGVAFLDRGQPVILGVVRDVTEQVKAYELLEQRVAERTRELQSVLDISREVASVLELAPLLELVLEELKVVTDYSWASVYGLENDELTRLAGSGGPTAHEPVRFPSEGRAISDRLRAGESVVVPDLAANEPLAVALRKVVTEHADTATGDHVRTHLPRPRSWMLVPLVFQGRTVGALSMVHEEPGHYTDSQAEFARAVANPVAVAIENARLYERSQQTAVLEERQRLARELHDAVTQTLFSASIMAEMLPLLWERDPKAGRQRLEDVRTLTRGALAEMRGLLLELRPAAIVEAKLGDLLRQLGEALGGRSHLQVAVVVEGEDKLPPEVRLAFYRVAQEALHNVDKHAAASRVEVQLSCGKDGCVLSISDDGRGFDPEASKENGHPHFGLANIHERVQRLGGTVSVRSQAGAGTEVRAQWSRLTKGEAG